MERHFPSRRFLTALHLLLVVALLAALLPPRAAHAQGTPGPTPVPAPPADDLLLSSYTLGECRTIERDALRGEIEEAALAVIGPGSNSLDIEAIVERAWVTQGADAVLEAEVAAAVEALRQETGYWQRLLSGWSAGKAEEFASEVAERAFASPGFNAMLNDLSIAIGEEIARSVNAELARAASAAFLCLRDYVGATYSETLFAAFEQSVSRRVEEAGVEIDADAIGINALDVHAKGLVGAGIIVVTEVGRRVATKISQKLAQRVAGKVVGRVAGRAGSSLVPVVGWVVGIGLILWDIYEGASGALPQIEDALTDEEVKERIRAEVADAVRASLPEEAAIAALETAVSMLEEWDAFCTRYNDVCTLAEENDSFRALLATVPLANLEWLARLQAVILRELGRGVLERTLETGQFDQLLALPSSAATILADTRSVEATLAWADLAGDDLDAVAANRIHERILPAELSALQLMTLLAMNDGEMVQKFLALDTATRNAIWALPPEVLRALLETQSEAELQAFAAAAQAPHITPTPVAVLVQGLLSGTVSIAQLQATPTAVAQQVPTPTQAGRATATPEPAGATAAATPTPGAPPAAAAVPGQNDPLLIGGLGLVVALLAAVAALLWLRPARRRR